MKSFSKNYCKLLILILAMVLTFSSCNSNSSNSNGSESGNSSLSSSTVGNKSSSSFKDTTSTAKCNGEEDKSETEYCSNGSKKTYGSVTYENQEYKTIIISTKTWMAENLNYEAIGSACYDNNTANCAKYGKLYDWATAMALPSKCNSVLSADDMDCVIETPHQGICPDEWHIPSDYDWKTARSWINCKVSGNSYSCEDTYGFNAQFGGSGSSNGNFNGADIYGSWWSATENAAYYAYFLYIGPNVARPYFDNKAFLYSVRCIQN